MMFIFEIGDTMSWFKIQNKKKGVNSEKPPPSLSCQASSSPPCVNVFWCDPSRTRRVNTRTHTCSHTYRLFFHPDGR